MEDFDYIHILRYLGYDVPIAKDVIELCKSRYGGEACDAVFKQIVKQAETHDPIDFRANILILSDRLYGPAIGIHYFMKKCTDSNVMVTHSEQETHSAAKKMEFDYMIIAGYLSDESNYKIIPILREGKNPPAIVMWALPDQLIRGICMEHKIVHVFNRMEPISKFIEFSKAI